MVTARKPNISTASSTEPTSKSKGAHEFDYAGRYWQSTQDTILGLYSKRDKKTGLPVESINDVIRRVAEAVAIAELRYEVAPKELIKLSLEQALQQPSVRRWFKIFSDHIGKQYFWANTPANINADPSVSLKVLQYWAHGKLAGLSEDEIWLRS